MCIGPAVPGDNRVRYVGLRYPKYLFPPFEWYGSRGGAATRIALPNEIALRLLEAKGVGGVARRVRFR